MKKTTSIPALLLAAVLGCTLLPGCAVSAAPELAGPEPEPPAAEYWDAAVEPAALKALTDFTGRTGEQVLRAGENVCYSPVSLYYALSMAASGAGGETQEELLDALGGADAETLPGWMRALYGALYRDEKHCKLTLDNSLWMQEGVAFRDSFTESAAENYYAASYTLDLSAPGAGETIGGWVSEKTHGLLRPSFQLAPDTVLVLLNTVYFKANWADEFSKSATASGEFAAAGGAVTCDFMHTATQGDAVAVEGYTMASLPFEGSVEMFFLLPDEGETIESLLEERGLASLLNESEAQYRRIEWSVPKFSVRGEMDLGPMLQELGVTDAFDPARADFSPMCDTTTVPGGSVWISEVKQGTAFSIDEEGAEAAAYTEIAAAGSAAPPDETIAMTLDRPFLYGLRDQQTGAVLFLGRMDDPTKEGAA